jgi:hypothetical protein
MGCGLDTTQKSITEAKDTCIEFQMSLRPEPDVLPSRIKYCTGSVSELAATENPRDRFLYRQQDGGDPERIGLVTQFSLKYYNKEGDLLSTPITDGYILGTIRIIELTMEVQRPFSSNSSPDGEKYFETALWKQTRLASQNLNR